MKWIKNLSIGLVLILAVDSCIKEPSYSAKPHIELQSLVFKKGALTQAIADTLIISLKFTDGNGDLGIGPDDALEIEYQNPFYWAYSLTDTTLLNNPDKTTPLPSGYSLLDYKAKKLPRFTKLPDINCQNWEQLSDNSSQPKVIDTLYITQNLRAFNINVNLYIKIGTDNYSLFDPSTIAKFPNCAPNLFRGKFPDLSNDRKNAPLDGIITFRIQSLGLYTKFNGKTLKMDVTINDRAFNSSNTVVKKDFTLQQIIK